MGAAPYFFACPVAKRNRDYTQDRRHGRIPVWRHKVTRTGRTKPNPSRRRGSTGRMLDTSHEYVCQCGHRGWTAHSDILHTPIDESLA